ncbi:tyrosine-type recombinase/integrase [Shouchella miscanthi]|uniref:Tyrosine-type recombinase/integrase n=1 Tax=Shouchella miscanthi TaxID=2598861 RepID=A0ABU6NG27_9BACI|nr:tyrosine-type recombinase/integrase [Shouchella miscanthi]MED4126982.1 tyrosine-type recombinase/integrase [Shouchella miscanthi]
MSIFAKINQQQRSNENQQQPIQKQPFRRLDDLPVFIHAYIQYIRSLGYSQATIQRYIYDFLDFFHFVERQSGEELFTAKDSSLSDFSQLNQQGIEYYVHYLAMELENEAKTINRKLSALQSLFHYLMKQYHLKENPVRAVTRPKVKKREPVYLSIEEMKAVMALTLNDEGLTLRQKKYHRLLALRDLTAITLLVRTGLRVSELASLKRSQLHVGRKEMQVLGKGNKQRTIPLTDEVLEVIQHYLQSLPETVQPKQEDSLLVGFDFRTMTYSRSISVSALQKMIQRLFERAKKVIPSLENRTITAHKLRHSFATALIRNGVNVLTLQQLLGHESVATTQVYAHVDYEAKIKAIQSW